MRPVTKLLINDFKIEELGFDFMGYSLHKKDSYNFHHLIYSHEYCRRNNLGDGYWYSNGVILCGNSSHPYLHLIERENRYIFEEITQEMVEMKNKGYIDKNNLIAIDQMLIYFENDNKNKKNKKGQLIIKPQYYDRNKFK